LVFFRLRAIFGCWIVSFILFFHSESSSSVAALSVKPYWWSPPKMNVKPHYVRYDMSGAPVLVRWLSNSSSSW
jgi:hypothetical protein